MRNSLIHFWPIHLAVVLGAAVTCAVVTGALLVGDSVRGSLTSLTLQRLGQIDYALVTQRFFQEDLSQRLESRLSLTTYAGQVAPAILLKGTAVFPKTGARASKVGIQGIDRRFLQVFDSKLDFGFDLNNPIGTPVAINQALQRELAVTVGDSILVSLKKPAQVNPEYVLGSREPFDLMESLRLRVAQIVPDQGLGQFSLTAHQNQHANVFLPLSVLQRALDQHHKVNALLVSDNRVLSEDTLQILGKAIQSGLQLEDLSLKIRHTQQHLILESSEMILSPSLEALTLAAAEVAGSPTRVLTYLANSIQSDRGQVPYSTVSALDPFIGRTFSELHLTSGKLAPALDANEILIDTWAAEDLKVQAGDSVEMNYYTLGLGEELLTKKSSFLVKGIVSLRGLAIDRTLTPEIPGVHDADDIASWDPPVPIDLNQIRPRDEEYWDRFGSAPKAFINFTTGKRLWSSRFGTLTSIRIGTNPGQDLTSTKTAFENNILDLLDATQFGFTFRPVKAEGLRASTGATDFGALFISFSFFLIISAALLVGLLFRLGIEQRAKEVGLLLSLGYTLSLVRRRFLGEGLLLAAVGSLLGLGGALAYAWLLLWALTTLWVGAVGAPSLSLHVGNWSLAIGYLITLLVVFITIWWSVRKLSEVPARVLLSGGSSLQVRGPVKSWVKATGFVTLGIALLLFVVSTVSDSNASVTLFFGIGTSLLIAGLSFFWMWLRQSAWISIAPDQVGQIVRLAARNISRSPGRSLLVTALVSSACFIIVAVGANRHEPGEELQNQTSGAGGFSILAQSDVPLHQNLNDLEGRFQLGFSDSDSDRLQGVEIVPFRVLEGEDMSCLNLYQPERPRILGVTERQISRGGFEFQEMVRQTDKPWTLLHEQLEPGVIPAFGDFNSVFWILHLGLGQDLPLENEQGETVKLRLMGLIKRSIFQSELLISEANFLNHFPSQSGFSYFLVKTTSPESPDIQSILERNLRSYGLDAVSTSEVLRHYLAVENTYLSTFQTLGGLGLLMGTLGLGIVLLRNVLERRTELATLRALGFQRSQLARIVLAENGLLLFLGILLGSLSALVAVAPHIVGGSAPLPWLSLAVTLLAVAVVGLTSGTAAVFVALRAPLLPALKSE